jgi:hypothetical protein
MGLQAILLIFGLGGAGGWLVYMAQSWEERNSFASESESKANVVVRYERGIVRYLRTLAYDSRGHVRLLTLYSECLMLLSAPSQQSDPRCTRSYSAHTGRAGKT